MARVTHVKAAQQRYATVPVLDENGQQVRTPVMDSRTGQQKVSKRGPVFRNVTKEDRSKPLPPLRCDYSGCTITEGSIMPGQPYKWIKPKSGPYGGRQMSRHAEHPSWNVWEYSQSLSARTAEIAHNFWSTFDSSTPESTEDVEGMLADCAQEIRDLASEKEEAADNMEDGFGHETYQSSEIRGIAEALESWADEVEGVTLPEMPEGEPRWYVMDAHGNPYLDEEGYEDEDEAQAALDAHLEANPDEDGDSYSIQEGDEAGDPTEEQMEEWLEEVRDVCSIVDECPV